MRSSHGVSPSSGGAVDALGRLEAGGEKDASPSARAGWSIVKCVSTDWDAPFKWRAGFGRVRVATAVPLPSSGIDLDG